VHESPSNPQSCGATLSNAPAGQSLRGVTPEGAAAALLGEGGLSEAQLGALDRLRNGNGSYDFGDLISWIDRYRIGGADCGGAAAGSGPADAAASAAAVPDPGFLTVEWTPPAGSRDTGVLLELEDIEAVRALGYDLYESGATRSHQIVVGGSLPPGHLVYLRVPHRNQLTQYRIHVLHVTNKDYGFTDAGDYRAVVTLH